MSDRTFDDVLRTNRRPRNRCPRCGEPTSVVVGIDIRQLNVTTRSPGRRVMSVSRNMCEPCAVEAYEMIRDAFALAVTS